MPNIRGVSQANSAGAVASFTVPKAPGTVSGDVVYLLHTTNSDAVADLGTPSGGAAWTLVATVGPEFSFCVAKLWKKTAGGSEPSTYTLNQTSADDGTAIVVALIDASLGAHVVATAAGQFGTTAVDTPSTTPVGPADLDLRFVGAYGTSAAATWTPPAGYTEQADVQSGTMTTSSLATKQLSSGAATGAQTFTISVTPTRWRSITVTVTGTATAVSVGDTASAANALSVSATTPLGDTAQAADALTAARVIALADAGAGVDAITTSAAVALADTATAVDTGANGQPVFFPDTAAAADTIGATVTGAGLGQAAAAVDTVAITATAALTSTAAAADALTYSEVLFPEFGDTAQTADTVTVVDVKDRDATAGPPRRSWSSRPPTI